MVKITMSNMHSQIRIQSNLSAPFTTHKGVRQGDALACLLFNIMLEYVIRSGIQTTGTIFYKLVQPMAYADIVVIIVRSLATVKEAFQLLEVASKQGGGISCQ
jgi:hypothetical protein